MGYSEKFKKDLVFYSVIGTIFISFYFAGVQFESLSKRICEYKNHERVTQIRDRAKKAKKRVKDLTSKLRGQKKDVGLE